MFWMKNMDAVQSETVPWCFTWTCIISPIFFLGKMCQDGCGIALSLQILVHGKTPEPHLFLLAAPGSTGCDCQVLPPAVHKHQLLHYFHTAVTASPPVLQAPHCSHCRAPGSKLFLLFSAILHSKGVMVFQTSSQTRWKSKEIISMHPKWDLSMKWHHLHPCLACDPLFCILFFAQSILMWYLCISILLKCTVLQLSLNVALLDY